MTRAPVEIVEVGPRDGLQSEPEVLAVETRVELIERLVGAGVRKVEVASFVNPRAVPQMAGAEEVVAALADRDDVTYVGLVLNTRGFERAAETAIDEVNVVVPVTDTFSERNQGTDTAGAIDACGAVAREAQRIGMPFSVVLSTAFGCPYEGEVPVARVVEVARQVAEHGPSELCLADTIGVAAPTDVRERLDAVRAAVEVPLHVHFHNTRNTGVANVAAAVETGVHAVDASIGGIGGCPFAPDATGNTATEDVAYLLERMGHPTGLDLGGLAEVVAWLEGALGRTTPGLYAKAGPFPPRP